GKRDAGIRSRRHGKRATAEAGGACGGSLPWRCAAVRRAAKQGQANDDCGAGEDEGPYDSRGQINVEEAGSAAAKVDVHDGEVSPKGLTAPSDEAREHRAAEGKEKSPGARCAGWLVQEAVQFGGRGQRRESDG